MDELRRQLERLGWSVELVDALLREGLPEDWKESSPAVSSSSIDSADLCITLDSPALSDGSSLPFRS